MPTLDYQSADDERRQRRGAMAVKRPVAWATFAEEIGGVSDAEHDRVSLPAGPWMIVLDILKQYQGRGRRHAPPRVYTRLRTAFRNPAGWRFFIYRGQGFTPPYGAFLSYYAALRYYDASTGHAAIDRECVVKATRPEPMPQLFAAGSLGDVFPIAPGMSPAFAIADNEGPLPAYPPDTDVLLLVLDRELWWKEDLLPLFTLMIRTLNALARLGLASNTDAGLRL